MSRVTVTALAGLAAALVVAVGLELRPRTRDDTAMGMNTVRIATAPGPGAASAAADQSGRWVEVILGRPLFAPDRRPAGGSPDAAPEALPRIAGILMDGAVRKVIFAATGSGRPVVVGEGDDVNGRFRVQSIEDDQVTVMGPDGLRVLRPSFDPKPPPAVAAGAPGLPGLPGLSGLTGIPGLPPPGAPGR